MWRVEGNKLEVVGTLEMATLSWNEVLLYWNESLDYYNVARTDLISQNSKFTKFLKIVDGRFNSEISVL